MAHLEDSSVWVTVGAYLRMLSLVALIWFSASANESIKRIGSPRLGLLAFGGGTLAASLIAVGSVVTLATAERVTVTGSIDPGAATALSDVASVAIGNGAPLGFAVLIGAAGIALLTSFDERRWIGWAHVVIALGLVSPIGWLMLIAVLAWIPAAGVWIYRMKSRDPALTAVG